MDKHYWSRQFLEVVEYPEDRLMGKRVLMGRPWRFSKADFSIKGPAPKLGGHNREMLLDVLGYTESQYNALETAGIIGDRPVKSRPATMLNLDEQVEHGRLAYYDPEYKEKLGIWS